jgi:hypothetical protein
MLAHAFRSMTALRKALASYPLSASSIAPSGKSLIKSAAEAIVTHLACRERPLNRPALGVDKSMDFSFLWNDRDNDLDPPFCRRALLMDANYGGIDPLQPAIMGLGDGIHEAVPNTCFAPSDKAIVAGGAWAVPLWQIAPWRNRIAAPRRCRSARGGHPRAARHGFCWGEAVRSRAIRNQSGHIGSCVA